MKIIPFFLIITIICLLSPLRTQSQTSIFPELGYAQINLNDWVNGPFNWVNSPSYTGTKLEKHKLPVLFYGIGLEQKFTKNFKFTYSSQYSSKISYSPVITGRSWTAGMKATLTEYHLFMNNLSLYYKTFFNISLGGGANHFQMRNFRYPEIESFGFVNESTEELKNQQYTFWGYHVGINYEWKNLGVFLKYSKVQLSKKDLNKDYKYTSYFVKKVPYFSLSLYYKFQIFNKINFQNRGKRKSKKKKSGCPTF